MWLSARVVFGLAVIIFSRLPQTAIADTANISGTCSIIIQGSNNTVNNAACNPSATPGTTVVRSKYMPVDLQDPAHPSLLHPTVIREDYGPFQKLTIFLVYPLTQPDGNYSPPANLIMTYAYQTTASGRYDPPPGTPSGVFRIMGCRRSGRSGNECSNQLLRRNQRLEHTAVHRHS